MPADSSAGNAEALTQFVAELARHRSSEWAWQHYKKTVLDLISLLSARQVIEIGCGRWPLLNSDEISSAQIRYVLNDINARELELAPANFEKFCFDIAQSTAVCRDDLDG